ncbi:MAG: hypothetical protein NVV59_19670 [Chitinophagaceae bacterium]|nr:hypothetical protein [Chitinophagaceae bacterium]
MSNACLVIVFNHRYDKNIPVLEKLYAPRFRNIRFLVPFYDGDRADVIPVYESSHYFQSYFAQGFHRFFDEKFSHYIFIGDDCILNPSINENNVAEAMGLAPGADFIPEFIRFGPEHDYGWWHGFKGVDFFGNRKGAEIIRELPSREEAVARFEANGVKVQPLTKDAIFGKRAPRGKKAWQFWLFKQFHFRYKWKKFRNGSKIELPYPIAGSYSDILVITRDTVRDFCRYCGIMGAAGLFVEIAIPTALLLTSKKDPGRERTEIAGQSIVGTRRNRSVGNRT